MLTPIELDIKSISDPFWDQIDNRIVPGSLPYRLYELVEFQVYWPLRNQIKGELYVNYNS